MLYNELHQGGIRALADYDSTIFDNMTLPTGIPDTDDATKQAVIDDILLRHGDQPLMVPDPAVMKYYIGVWSARMAPLWLRYYNATVKSYDPIENYRRTQQRTDGNTRTLNTNEATTGTDTLEDSVSAENVNTYAPDEKTVRTANLGVADTGTITDAGYDNSTIFGNIGVTTSQQMLNAELDLIPRLDFIRYISDSFQAEFCLGVY